MSSTSPPTGGGSSFDDGETFVGLGLTEDSHDHAEITAQSPTHRQSLAGEKTQLGVGFGESLYATRGSAPAIELPSLLRTQMGMGALQVDEHGRPLQATRFAVSAGGRPGQLVLTPIPEGIELGGRAIVVSLLAQSPEDQARLDQLVRGR